MSFRIIRNDITKVQADAIVNTANPLPVYGPGTDAAIYQAAGAEELLAARKAIGDIPRGEAVETKAFGLRAKYIIHTVGPIWEGGDNGEFDILKACYVNSLALAEKLKCHSIAFPLISSGSYGFPKDKALQIALSVIQPFVMEHTMKVLLVVFDKTAFQLSGTIVENVREYVNAHYVEEAITSEYGYDYAEYIREYRSRRSRRNESLITPIFDEKRANDRSHASVIDSGTRGGLFLPAPELSFQQKLFEIIDERGLSGPEVYKNYISRQVYSKLQSDVHYQPTKFTALALCLSLHLTLQETTDLLGRAGLALSPSRKADLVVQACILNKEYNLVQINIILFDYGCPPLEKIK